MSFSLWIPGGWPWPLLAAAAAIVITVYILAVVGRKKSEAKASAKLPKGSLGWPVIGESLQFMSSLNSSSPERFIDERRNKYGRVFRTHLFGRKTIVSVDPSVSKWVLQSGADVFVPWYPGPLMELLGEGSVFHMSGAEHRKLHGVVGGFVKSSGHKSQVTERMGRCLLDHMRNWEDGSVVLFQNEAKEVLFQILVKTLTGLEMGSELRYFMEQYRQFTDGFISLPIKIPGFTFYKSLQAKKRILKFMENIVKERRSNMEKDKNNETDVIGLLLKSQTDRKIVNNIVDFIVPGEDSVPSLVTLAIKFLSGSPDALQQLEEENMDLRLKKVNSGEALDWSDFMSLSFTQNVISETLRMANVVNGVYRKALKDVDFQGHLIPQGWCVVPYFRGLHFDKDIYQDPYKFNPWRWQNEEIGGVATYTPFGGGLRLCPGMELTRLEVSIFLHYMVTRFRWVAQEDTITNFPFVTTKRGMPIIVTRKANIEQGIY